MMTRIQTKMKKGGALLQGIIEANETYIGGKPRKPISVKTLSQARVRGHGREKDAVIGAVQRGGKVVAQFAPKLTGRAILAFIKRAVKIGKSELMMDAYRAYHLIG